jgi:hypothetical protein
VGDRGQLVQHARIVDQDVEPPEALDDRGAERVDLLGLLHEVQHEQRGGAARGGADQVVRLLQPALGAGDQHGMRAEPRELDGQRRADPARGTGEEGDATVQRRGHWPAACSRVFGRSALLCASVSGMA